jgi:uncharacterized protein (UPF0335 family)
MSRGTKTATSAPIIDMQAGGEIVAVRAAKGHNSQPDVQTLRAAITSFERLDEAAKALNEQRGDQFRELKAKGFDIAVVRLLLRRRRVEPDALAVQDSLISDLESKLAALDNDEASRARARARPRGREDEA